MTNITVWTIDYGILDAQAYVERSTTIACKQGHDARDAINAFFEWAKWNYGPEKPLGITIRGARVVGEYPLVEAANG